MLRARFALALLFSLFLPFATVSSEVDSIRHPSMHWTFQGERQHKVILDTIADASRSLEIAIFTFTDPDIAAALLEAKKRGVDVKIITDRSQSEKSTQHLLLQTLAKHHIPIKTNRHPGLMHLKMLIADYELVLTGSYNFSNSARRTNDELLMRLRDRIFVADCLNAFGFMWNDKDQFVAFE